MYGCFINWTIGFRTPPTPELVAFVEESTWCTNQIVAKSTQVITTNAGKVCGDHLMKLRSARRFAVRDYTNHLPGEQIRTFQRLQKNFVLLQNKSKSFQKFIISYNR